MLVSTLMNRFRLLNAEPDAGGTGTVAPSPAPAPAAEAPAPVAAPGAEDATAAPAAAPAAKTDELGDPFAGLTSALDKLTEGTAPPRAPTPAPTPAPTAAPAPGATPAPAPKAADIDLTPPEGMSDRAKERWGQLTERAKLVPELERRATEAATALDSVRRLVNDSGLNANEFTDLIEVGRMTKSANPQELQKALAHIEGMREQIAQRLGVELPGVDPLAAHPDLKADVEAMALTKERALEIAKLRGKGQQADAMTAEQREIATFQTTVRNAAATMENTLKQRAGQPGHEQKLQFIHGHFAQPQNLQAFVKNYQPDQWPAALLLMYDTYQVPAPVPAPPPAGPQPLRPGAVRSGVPVVNGPVTTNSALENAFAAAGL